MGKSVAYKIGDSDERPWGRWEVLSVKDEFVVKLITVFPAQVLALQWHHHRNEHWIITAGVGEVTLGEDIMRVETGGTVFIPKTVVHRIKNPTDDNLCFIEIQTGDILDENDIERLEDAYGRLG